MKSTLLFTTFLFTFLAPAAFAKSELELLRQRCAEQERQIRLLEEENLKLRLAGERYRPTTSTAATPAPAATAPASTTTSAASTYTIKPGDSVERIARRHNTTAATLIRLNNIKDPLKIQPGQTLKLPAAPAASTVAATPKATATPAPTPAAKAPTSGSHVVASGETFYSIGKKYGISVNQLTAANPGIKPSALRPGQRLQLGTPATGPAPTRPAPLLASGPPQTVSTAKPPAAPLPSVPEPQKTAAKPEVRLIKIQSPTTYGEFARIHGNSVERLNELNNLELGGDTVLAVGSELYASVQP